MKDGNFYSKGDTYHPDLAHEDRKNQILSESVDTVQVFTVVTLDTNEVNVAQAKAMNSIDAVDELEDEKKRVMKEYYDNIKEAKAKSRELRTIARKGVVEKDVECAVIHVHETRLVLSVNPENGEILNSRPMTAEEKQLSIDAFGKPSAAVRQMELTGTNG